MASQNTEQKFFVLPQNMSEKRKTIVDFAHGGKVNPLSLTTF